MARTRRTPLVFLLSPARCGGERAALLCRSRSDLGEQLRADGAELGAVFAWLSALYFRGKLTYANHFARPQRGEPGVLVMTPGDGLRPPETRIAADDLRRMGTIEIQSDAFVQPLRRDAEALAARVGDRTQVVLLGSVATSKYIRCLLDVFGPRLLFPDSFVGRGDMSRGGLLLRAARSGEELTYAPIEGAVLRGKRPPKLPRLPRASP